MGTASLLNKAAEIAGKVTGAWKIYDTAASLNSLEGFDWAAATIYSLVNALPLGSICYMNSNGSDPNDTWNPYPQTGVAADQHGVLTIIKYNFLGRYDIKFEGMYGRVHIATSLTENGVTWVRRPNAESPAVYSLPLAAEFAPVRDGSSWYQKDPFNVVSVTLCANKRSGNLNGWGELYATLPAGYRPGQRLEFPVTFGQPWSSGSLYVETDGTIAASASSLPNAGLYTAMACFSFVAAS